MEFILKLELTDIRPLPLNFHMAVNQEHGLYRSSAAISNENGFLPKGLKG